MSVSAIPWEGGGALGEAGPWGRWGPGEAGLWGGGALGEDGACESSLWEAKDDAKVVLADVVGSTVLLKGKLRKGRHRN